MKIAIIGGGIGGLSAALHLLKAGLDVQVYEQASRIGEIGAGIQISPNASRLLIRLGLKPALDKAGVRPLAVHQRRWEDGRTLQRAPLGPEVETLFGAPYYHFHRADLANLLADAAPGEADLVIGADGIHSRVRASIFGPEKPRYTGCVVWRGMVPAERIAHLDI